MRPITPFIRPRKQQPLDPLLQSLKALSPRTRITQAPEDIHLQIVREAASYAIHKEPPSNSQSTRPGLVTGSLAFDIAMTALRKNKDVDEKAFGNLVSLSAKHPQIISSLILEAAENDSFTPALYDVLAKHTHHPSQPEQYLLVIGEMLERNIAPSASLIAASIRVFCAWGLPRLAVDLAEKVENTSTTGQRIEIGSWIDILIASADNFYLEGVDLAWSRTSKSRSYTPDEGLILRVLNTAARWGRPDLATRALESLALIGAPAQEYHLVALLESYVIAGQVPEAFRVVSFIRANGMIPSLHTVEPIAAVLISPEIIDQAYYGLEDMHKAGETIDIASVNALILACARLGDLRRARATQTALTDFDLKPDIDTFNLILDACIIAKHRPLGDTILSEMAAAGIAPEQSTHERFIKLCLIPEDYDDSFFYLEKLKAEGVTPSASVYSAILERCLSSRDGRWKLVEEEMKSLNYTIEPNHRRMISALS